MHSAEKCKKRDPFGFINIHSVANYQKNSKGGPFGDIKKDTINGDISINRKFIAITKPIIGKTATLKRHSKIFHLQLISPNVNFHELRNRIFSIMTSDHKMAHK